MAGSSDESGALTWQRSESGLNQLPRQPKMEDLQQNKPKYEIDINKVGITNLVLPLKINFGNKIDSVQGNISVFVDLPKNKRGTHMSRLVRILTEESEKVITFSQIEEILNRIKKELEANHSYLDIEFILFDLKEAPVTKNKGYVSYKCLIKAEKNNVMKIRFGAEILVTTLCPISKGVSKYSAHNQRGRIIVEVLCKDKNLDIKELISSVEKCGSSELYSLLKREDEKFVTEKAYDNPKIVEDMIREVAELLKRNRHISEFKISCENLESIHLHNAFSEVVGKND